jgi:regulator of protease activity HflC (stomatin/prohibitin superfamily)
VSLETTLLILLAVVFGGALVVSWVLKLLSQVVDVQPHQLALVFVDGKKTATLESGRHRIWNRKAIVQTLDPRAEWVQVLGQELVTQDGAPIRVSVAVLRSVVDVDLFAAVQDVYSAIYVPVQLAVRDQVTARDLDALLADRAAVEAAMTERVQADIGALGMRVDRLAIRDLTLIGDTKRAYAEVVQAQLQAKASLERARGEAATMRSLLNTAELVRKNPELLQLRALQQIGQGGHQIQVHLGLDGAGEKSAP